MPTSANPAADRTPIIAQVDLGVLADLAPAERHEEAGPRQLQTAESAGGGLDVAGMLATSAAGDLAPEIDAPAAPLVAVVGYVDGSFVAERS